jgi:hypothetical protein
MMMASIAVVIRWSMEDRRSCRQGRYGHIARRRYAPFVAARSPSVRRPRLSLLAAVSAAGLGLLIFAAGSAFAGASTQNIPPSPPIDPTAKNLTPYMISLRAFDACLIVQSRLQGKTREEVHTPCSCYAKLTVKNMSKEEIDAFRATGYFNDTARQKALSALDSCKLPHPPLN